MQPGLQSGDAPLTRIQERKERLDAPRLAAFAAIILGGVALVVVSLSGAPSIGAGVVEDFALTEVRHTTIAERAALEVADDNASGSLVQQGNKPVQLAALKQASAPTQHPVIEQPADIAKEIQEIPTDIMRQQRIRRGDTLMKVLVRAGAPRRQVHAAIAGLGKTFNPRRLKAGQELEIAFDATAGAPGKKDAKLLSVRIQVDVERDVITERGEKGFAAREIIRELSKSHARASGTINDSLYLSARRSGMPIAVLMEMIRIFSWDVDFQRDIQRGDAFEIFYEQFANENGEVVKYGDILFASMGLSGTDVSLYRHTLSDGAVDYFNEKGQSARKALLRTPVNGARLSSRYGKRRHPVLGYTKMHRGIDFAAPRGTPIMAGGDGVIEMAQRNGSYGNYVRIRHNNNYKTAYAHLKGYAKGIRRGKRVRQGQIIGYIGTTGRSTGPHLHYEILKKGRQINPLHLKLPTGRKLKGKALAHFQKLRASTDHAMAATLTATEVASSQ